MQPHFHFAYCIWYPNPPMSLKNKLQTAQNAYIRFCLGMERRNYIGLNHFKKINWLPIKNKVYSSIAVTAFTFKNNFSPVYMSDINTLNFPPNVVTRRTMNSFVEPVYMKEISRKPISYLESNIWNDLDRSIRTSNCTNNF